MAAHNEVHYSPGRYCHSTLSLAVIGCHSLGFTQSSCCHFLSFSVVNIITHTSHYESFTMSGTGHILNDSVRPVAKVNGMSMHANRELLTGSLGLIREHRNI